MVLVLYCVVVWRNSSVAGVVASYEDPASQSLAARPRRAASRAPPAGPQNV